jgi:drug/metabolite transporter (DMT)-like permease/ADP-ribose pyrophosphatase YjhB (NUDIX family)
MNEYVHQLEIDGEEVTLTWVGRSKAPPARVHALAFNSAGEIMLVSDGPADPNRWLPGGGVKEGEKPEEALRRELLEEADAAIESLEYLGAQQVEGFQMGLEYRRYYWCRVTFADQGQPREEATLRHTVPPTDFLDTLQWGRSDPAAPLLLDLALKAEHRYSQDPQRSRPRAILLALFVVFLWATSWVLIKIGLQEIPALPFAGLRYMLAFFCLLPFAVRTQRRQNTPTVPKRVLRQLLLLGLLLYAVTQGAIFLALAYLPAVTVNLLWSFSSITVAILGIMWLAERPTRFQWVGLGLATIGAVIYFYPAALPAGYLIGIVVSVVGVIANAGASILGRSVNRSGEIHPLVVTAASMGAGAIVLLVVGISTQGLPTITLKGWAIIAWLALVNTALAFTIWNYTLRTLSAMESSIINGTMIIWIPVLAVLFLGEHVSSKELLGLLVVGLGTLIVQLRSSETIPRFLRWRTARRDQRSVQ